MAKTDFKSIDEYIATFSIDIQQKLEEIRQIIHAAVPEAKEVISYQIPCFNHYGPVLYFSAFKSHLSIAAPPPTFQVFKEELSSYKTSVSVFQIPYDKPIPAQLIAKIAKYRAQENVKEAKA